MKLYLFKPSKKWSYCGGGLAIIANSFEECKKEFDEDLFYSEDEIPEGTDSFNIWVFVESFNVVDEMPRKVFSDYNWG